MNREIPPEKIQGLVYSPVVSDTDTTPEAKLMREIKKVEVQSNADTKYDAIVESFETKPLSIPLIGVAVALFLLLASAAVRRK